MHLTLSPCELEGSLEDVIERLEELSNQYGKDKRLSLEIKHEHHSFDSRDYIVVHLEGE